MAPSRPGTTAELKSPEAEEAFNPENLACRATRAVKEACGQAIGVVCDVALDPYTSHGQDGLVRDEDRLQALALP